MKNNDVIIRHMRTSILSITLALLIFPCTIKAQNSTVDKLFTKYSGKEGFTSVYISKYMFSLFSEVDDSNKEMNDVVSNLNSIRILALDQENPIKGLNFYKEIMKELPQSEYKELMVVKEKGQDLKFLVKESNGRIMELLLIIGGEKDNALICIQGDNIDLKKINGLSKSMNIQGLEKLDKIEEKNK